MSKSISKYSLISILLLSTATAADAQKTPPKEGDDWWSTHVGSGTASKPKPQSPQARCESEAKGKQGKARQQFIDRCIAQANKKGK